MVYYYILLLLSFALISIVITFILYFYNNAKQINRKISTPAKIISKSINFTNDESYYVLIFELYTGKKLKFHVDAYHFTQYNNGDKGILTYIEDKFISFRKKY